MLSTIKSMFNVELERSEFHEEIEQVIHYLEDDFVGDYLDVESDVDYEEILNGLQEVGETRIDIEMLEAFISNTIEEFTESHEQVSVVLASLCNLRTEDTSDNEAQ